MMDDARAKRLTTELLGKSVGAWQIVSFAGAGKSALVFKAKQGTTVAALKVFDPELIDRFGKPIQRGRINRELTLRGLHHPHLIRILDGGECSETDYFYVAMEFLDAPNLGKVLKDVPRDRIWPIISQIAKAARFLEEHGLAHRDIKPENIAIDKDFQHATLLDLGVLRPFGDPSLTDDQARPFIGTLRYSSPEFLLRQEEDTIDGWRAVTFYQLGAVLHDMIMGEPLFSEDSEPYAVLVDAVKSRQVSIEATDVAADLIVLASNCLVKSPSVRNQIVTWNRFDQPTVSISSADAAKARVKHRRMQTKGQSQTSDSVGEPSGRATIRLLTTIKQLIENFIRQECSDSFPRFELTEPKSIVNDATYLRLSFEHSEEFDLRANLSVLITIKIIDLDSKAIRLQCVATMSRSQVSDSDLIAYDGALLFAGVHEKVVAEARVRDVLYIALDGAQSIAASELDSASIILLTTDLAGGAIDV